MLHRKKIEKKRNQYTEGAGWGTLKNELFEYLNHHLAAKRQVYLELMNDLGYVEGILGQGAEKARVYACDFLARIKSAVGIRSLHF